MGRRAKDESEKRKLIGARYDPDVFAFLEAQAEANSRSTGAEVEERVAATHGLDAEGVALVADIAAEMGNIQRLTGKRWHRDLKTWAAVKEMLVQGPLEERRPDRSSDDEQVNEAWQRFRTLSDERREIIEQFKRIGVTLTEDPKPPKQRGIFGMQNALAAMASPWDGGRTIAREMFESAPDSNDKQTALQLLDRLLELDRLIKEADDTWGALLMPYIEAEFEGRMAYRERLTREAERKRDAGEPFNVHHLYGQFR